MLKNLHQSAAVAVWVFGLAALILAAQPATAGTISAHAEIAETSTGVVDSETHGPGPGIAGSYFADAGMGGWEPPPLAMAYMNTGGVGAVFADGVWSDGGEYTMEAKATWSDTITNTSGGPLSYDYGFSLTPARLTIYDWVNGPTMLAAYEVRILLNGSAIFESTAELEGLRAGITLSETGTDLGGTSFGLDSSGVPAGNVFGYDFGSYSDTLSLGSLADGASLIISYEIIARVFAPGFESGAGAYIGDPNDPGSTPGFSGAITTSDIGQPLMAPLPAPFALTAVGLGLLALGRRMRRRR